MQIEIKHLDQCMKELTITVPKDDAQKDYAAVIRNFSKYVVVPGYRKGKAPLSMVNSMFGDKINETYLSEKVSDYFTLALEDEEIEPLYEPQIVDVKWKPGEELVAVFRYEVAPVIDVSKFTGLEVPLDSIPFNEDMVNITLENFRKKEPMIDQDVLEVNQDSRVVFTGRFTSPEKQEDQLPADLLNVSVADNSFGEEFNKAIIGAKKGDVIETTVSLEDNEKHPVSLTVFQILKVSFPDLDDEFAKKQGFDSLDDFREAVRIDLAAQVDKENEKRKMIALNLALIAANSFDLPPTAVLEFSKNLAQPYAEYYNKPVEELAQEYLPMALYEMKSYYIIGKLVEEIKPEITAEDENNMIERMANELKLGKEEFLERNPDVTKQPDFVERVTKEKVYDYLYEHNTFVAKKEEQEDTDEPVSGEEA